MLNLGELRKILKIGNNLSFIFKSKDIKYKTELDFLIKHIIIDNDMIILKENKIYININVIDKKVKTVYKSKFLTSESLCDLRKQLKIKNEYKFLSENGEFILLSQENEYKIIDILANEFNIVLKYDISYENSFSNKEMELIQNYYYLRINDKKTYKMMLNHDFFLSEVRNKIVFNDIRNYFFLNLKGNIIR